MPSFAAAFEQVHARIEGLRTDLEGEARNQRDKIAGDLRALEGLIKHLSRELTVTAAAAAKGQAEMAQSAHGSRTDGCRSRGFLSAESKD